jgi:hypothetical protein
MTSFHVVVGLGAIISVLITTVYACLQGIKRYKKENMELRGEIQNAAARLERLKEYTAKNKNAEEAANAERRELNETADGGLAGRANNLFGVRDKGGGNGAA